MDEEDRATGRGAGGGAICVERVLRAGGLPVIDEFFMAQTFFCLALENGGETQLFCGV